MQMLVMLWRILTKLLRHLGWGILLVPVAAMGIVLFGLSLWTVAAVILAAVVAVQWPGAAARALPVTMVGAGLSGLAVASRISGSPVNWVMQSISRPFAQVRLPPGKGLVGGTRWVSVGAGGRMQVSFSPKAYFQINQAAVNLKQAGVNARAKRAPVPKQVIVRKGVIVPQQQVPPGKVIGQQSITFKGPQRTITFNGPLPGPGRAFTAIPRKAGGPPPGLAKLASIHGRPPWAIRSPVYPPAGLWHGRLLVPVALLLLTLGLWLAPRSLAGLRGRGATLAPEVRRWLVENRWGVLLVPVSLIGLTVFGVHPWTIATIVAAVVVLARWPRIAGDLVPVVLAVFAVRGFRARGELAVDGRRVPGASVRAAASPARGGLWGHPGAQPGHGAAGRRPGERLPRVRRVAGAADDRRPRARVHAGHRPRAGRPRTAADRDPQPRGGRRYL